MIRPAAGRSVPAIRERTLDFPAPFGTDEGERLAVGDVEGDMESALGDNRLQGEGHALTRRRATAMMSTATIISTKDSATAAWGSLSRCR